MDPSARKWLSPKRLHRIFLVAIFLVTGIALYLSFPREARFRYEYQKGRPWMHATLYAPYNFAILKSETEIAREKDSLLNDQVPYFIYADSVTQHELSILMKNLDRAASSKAVSSGQFLSLKLKLSGIYADVYHVGIIDQHYVNNPNLLKKGTLKIVKNNIGKEIQLSSVYSLKSAYNEIHRKIDELKSLHPEWNTFLEDLQPDNYLSSNLIFDQEKNRQMKEKILENLSSNHGIVQEGERIVSQGDIISANTFKILESLRITFENNRGENAKYILVVLGKIMLIFVLLLTLYFFLLNMLSLIHI